MTDPKDDRKNDKAWREARDAANEATMASSEALDTGALTDVNPEALAKGQSAKDTDGES